MSNIQTETIVQAKDPLTAILSLQAPANLATVSEKPVQVVTPQSFQRLPPIPESVLGPQGRCAVDAVLQQLPVETLTLEQVVMLGIDTQRQLGSHIDRLLQQVRRQDSPALFDLFEQLATGVKEANLEQLEKSIKKGESPGWLVTFCENRGWSNPADRMRKVAEDLKGMLTQKSDTLLTLVQDMQSQAVDEVRDLVLNLGRIDSMGRSYLESVHSFAVATQIANELLARARVHEQALKQTADTTNDPHHRAIHTDFELLVQQLESRALALRTGYEKIPANLAVLAIAKGAASTTLAETAAGLEQQFLDLKSALLNWYLLLGIQDAQRADERRREVTELLQRHGLNILDRVATTAAASQGVNRLTDAKMLLEISQGLGAIRVKVQGLTDQRNAQFLEAETALSAARQTFISLPTPVIPAKLTDDK